MGHPRIAMASTGLPPIAYTSLIAFAEAIRPKLKGSSTIGIKKSVVEISAVPLPISNTAASSLLWLPTINLSLSGIAILPFKITSNTCGEILQPQPAP